MSALDGLFKKKDQKGPAQAPVAQPDKPDIAAIPDEPIEERPAAASNPFAALSASVARANSKPAPAIDFNKRIPVKTNSGNIDLSDITSMQMTVGEGSLDDAIERANSADAPVAPSLDPDLENEHNKAINYYEEQIAFHADNPVVRTLFNHLRTICEELRTPDITEAFHDTMQYLDANSELHDLLKPHDIGLLVQAIQASTGRVIAKKTERQKKTSERKKRQNMFADMLGDW